MNGKSELYSTIYLEREQLGLMWRYDLSRLIYVLTINIMAMSENFAGLDSVNFQSS